MICLSDIMEKLYKEVENYILENPEYKMLPEETQLWLDEVHTRLGEEMGNFYYKSSSSTSTGYWTWSGRPDIYNFQNAISQISVDNGHVTGIQTRNITPANNGRERCNSTFRNMPSYTLNGNSSILKSGGGTEVTLSFSKNSLEQRLNLLEDWIESLAIKLDNK